MTTIDAILDGVVWIQCKFHGDDSDLPHVTHSGVLKIADLELTVYQLSNGERVIEADGLEKLLFPPTP